MANQTLQLYQIHQFRPMNTGDIWAAGLATEKRHTQKNARERLRQRRRPVIFLKSGTHQENERRRASPEQHPGDTEGPITSKMSALRRALHSHQASWKDRRWGTTVCTFIREGREGGEKGTSRPESEHRTESAELWLQQYNRTQWLCLSVAVLSEARGAVKETLGSTSVKIWIINKIQNWFRSDALKCAFLLNICEYNFNAATVKNRHREIFY